MRALFKLLIVVVLLLIAGASAVFYEYEQSVSAVGNLNGSYNVLLLCDDPTEDNGTEGIGSVDMAFVLNVTDGKVMNVTTIYPGGLRSAVYTEPTDLGSGMLLLHDSLYGVNTTFGAERAQEIVEYNKGIKTDVVVMVTPDAVDALLAAVGPIEVNGQNQTITDSIGYIRNMTEQSTSTETRGEATSSIMNPIISAAEGNPTIYFNLAKVAIEQYHSGNIRVVPEDIVTQFAVDLGMKSLLGS